jgi:hypothetical protein
MVDYLKKHAQIIASGIIVFFLGNMFSNTIWWPKGGSYLTFTWRGLLFGGLFVIAFLLINTYFWPWVGHLIKRNKASFKP